MSSNPRDTRRLMNRVRRIRGQIEAVERGLADELDCPTLMQRVASCRGALNGLLAAIVEEHIRTQLNPARGRTSGPDAREQLIEAVHSYFR